jgi:outer membrane protein
MRKLAFIIIISALTTTAYAQRTVSLQECINLATDNNLQLKQGAAGVEFSEKAANQSRLLLLPNLNLGSSYFWNFGYTIDPGNQLTIGQ